MNLLLQYLDKYFVLLVIAALTLFSTLLYFKLKRSLVRKFENVRGFEISKHDYVEFNKNDDKVLTNTTITFDAKKQKDDDASYDELYLRSASIGQNLLKKEYFSIANVGDI